MPPNPVDTRDFRQAMSRLGAAVNIVATDGPSGTHGITASAVCSVTDTPPTLLVCVNRSSSVHDVILANGVLSVSVLGGDHEALAMRFGKPGIAPEERFAGAVWRKLATGAPILESATVAFDCRVADLREVGTHSVIFAQVLAISTGESRRGLIYFDRDFHTLHARSA